MQSTVAILLLLALGVVTARTQNVGRIMEKTRGLGEQMTERHNAAENGGPPPGLSPKPGTTKAPVATQPASTTPAAAPAKAGTQQQAASKLKADIAAARTKGEVSPDAIKQFAQDLQLAVLGRSQPSAATLTQFTEQFLPTVTAKHVAPTGDAKLVQNIVVSLNCAGLSPSRMAEITGEVESAMTKAGVTTDAAAKVSKQLDAIIAEVQSGSAK